MKRSGVAYWPRVCGLEGRVLQARAAMAVGPPLAQYEYVGFNPPSSVTSDGHSQQVTQQSGDITVVLMRSGSESEMPPVQVRVTTDPASPYVGVNVAEVNQVVTFGQGESQATLTVPIIPGAPNPGEVDVALSITLIDPPPWYSVPGPPLELRIMASDALLPPKIIAENGTPDGIELTFNKPMDPVRASNVKNYRVTSTTFNMYMDGGLIGWAIHGLSGSRNTYNVPLKSAVYNADTNTVTLIPRRRLTYNGGISVSEGHPPHAAGRAHSGAVAAGGLVDLYGNPIDQATTPGKFHVGVLRCFYALSSG